MPARREAEDTATAAVAMFDAIAPVMARLDVDPDVAVLATAIASEEKH